LLVPKAKGGGRGRGIHSLGGLHSSHIQKNKQNKIKCISPYIHVWTKDEKIAYKLDGISHAYFFLWFFLAKCEIYTWKRHDSFNSYGILLSMFVIIISPIKWHGYISGCYSLLCIKVGYQIPTLGTA
jgi:hypothetical protein